VEPYHRKYFRCRWLAWLVKRGLSLDQAAIVLELDPAIAEAAWADHRRSGRSDPDAPPGSKYYRPRGAKTIRAEQARKVRKLRELTYSARQIAHILALSARTVSEFLERDAPLPHGPRVKPRSRTEQSRVQAASRRRRQRERRRADLQAKRAAIASWGSLSGRHELAESVEVPAPIAHQLVAELPADVTKPAICAATLVNPWTGPRSPHATKSRSHL
jgi:predicted transcriptional regulator